MKKFILPAVLTLIVFVACYSSPGTSSIFQTPGYIIESEKSIAKSEPGTHDGGGMTTGYNFFSAETDSRIVFRKRVLLPGSAIGYHLQKEEEIYYILEGSGILQMNGKDIPVTAGDCILTKPGSSHGLKPLPGESLTLIINFLKK